MSSPQLTVTVDRKRIPSPFRIAFVPVAVGLNLAIGTLAHALRLPLYLDAIGTIIATLLLGWRAGILTGVASFLLGGLITNPVLPWFSGTQAAIAVYVYLLARAGWFKNYVRVILSGLGLGVVAGIVSAPVIVYLFGGITGSGPSVIVGFLLSTGHTLLKSVFMSGLACEPFDKASQCLIAYWIIKGLPPKLTQQLSQAAKDGKA